MSDPGRVVAGQLQRLEFVIVPGAQVGCGFILGRQRQPEDAVEKIQAVVVAVGVDLDMTQMRVVATRFHRVSLSEFVDGPGKDRLKAFGILAVAPARLASRVAFEVVGAIDRDAGIVFPQMLLPLYGSPFLVPD